MCYRSPHSTSSFSLEGQVLTTAVSRTCSMHMPIIQGRLQSHVCWQEFSVCAHLALVAKTWWGRRVWEAGKGETCGTHRSKSCKGIFSGCTSCVFPQQRNEATGVCEVILVIKAVGVLWVLEDCWSSQQRRLLGFSAEQAMEHCSGSCSVSDIDSPFLSSLFLAIFRYLSSNSLPSNLHGRSQSRLFVQCSKRLVNLVAHLDFLFQARGTLSSRNVPSWHWAAPVLKMKNLSQNETVLPPFLYSYSQGLCCCRFLSGLLSFPRAILFIDNIFWGREGWSLGSTPLSCWHHPL